MEIVKLRFPSGLHVDQKGANQFEVADEFLHSDTLSSAVLLTWQILFPEDENEGLFSKPRYLLSSAFPFVGDLLLFPKPLGPIWASVDVARRKDQKKIKWLSPNLIKRFQRGERLDLEGVVLLNKGTVAVDKEEQKAVPFGSEEKLWTVQERQRVTVDRLGCPEGGDTFFFATLHFRAKCGLWFAYEAEDKRKFLSVLTLLGDNGIGSDRGSGLGHFTLETKVAPQDIFDFKGDYHITLSLYNPLPEEDVRKSAPKSCYDIKKRSGWVSNSTVGRPHIFAFLEGSFFPFKPKGRVVKVLRKEVIDRFRLPIDHEVYRDLRAFAIPCKAPSFLAEASP